MRGDPGDQVQSNQECGVQEGDPGEVRHEAAAEVQHHHQGETPGDVQAKNKATMLSKLQVSQDHENHESERVVLFQVGE